VKRGRILDVLLMVCFIATLGLAFTMGISPDNGLELGGKPLGNVCIFRQCFGISCPFCGVSRSMVALAHGRFIASLSFHPMGPLISVAFCFFVVTAGRSLWRRDSPVIESPVFARIAIGFAIASLASWPLRAVIGALPATTYMVLK